MILENQELKDENEMLRDELDKISEEMIERYCSTPKFLLDKIRGKMEEDEEDDDD